MITIKLPIKNKIDISEYQKQFNSCVRYSYNRFVDGLKESDIYHNITNNKLFQNLDSWFVRCANKEAESWFKKVPSGKLIFGGKDNFIKRCKNKISNDEWKEKRLYILVSQGEKHQKGNRKFELDILNNKIIFKPKYKNKIFIELPKLRKNLKNRLEQLEILSKSKKIPITFQLTNSYIYIIYDEKVFKKEQYLLENRVIGIDLNPNYIGVSILEFDENDNFKILKPEVISNKILNEKLEVSSDHPTQIYQNNKKNYENFQIIQHLITLCKHYKCKKFVVEDLSIKSKDHNKGKNFNRLINNCWNRNKFLQNLEKHCNLQDIELIKVNPIYSSFIGNLIHGEKYPDQVASSIEISRRGYKKWQKNWFYPNLITKEILSNRWKEAIEWKFKDWKELFSIIKTLKLNYRSSLSDFKLKVFSLHNIKSMVDLHQPIYLGDR
jgi:IS605 OrfB family transposase